MVKFRVQPTGGREYDEQGDYKITDGGVLAIKPKEGNPIIYGPGAWVSVEVLDAPEKPAPGDVLWSTGD